MGLEEQEDWSSVSFRDNSLDWSPVFLDALEALHTISRLKTWVDLDLSPL